MSALSLQCSALATYAPWCRRRQRVIPEDLELNYIALRNTQCTTRAYCVHLAHICSLLASLCTRIATKANEHSLLIENLPTLDSSCITTGHSFLCIWNGLKIEWLSCLDFYYMLC